MSHARSGLPPLNLEPFDPTPLYAAARARRHDKAHPNHRAGHGRLRVNLVVPLLLALVLGGLAVVLLL